MQFETKHSFTFARFMKVREPCVILPEHSDWQRATFEMAFLEQRYVSHLNALHWLSALVVAPDMDMQIVHAYEAMERPLSDLFVTTRSDLCQIPESILPTRIIPVLWTEASPTWSDFADGNTLARFPSCKSGAHAWDVSHNKETA